MLKHYAIQGLRSFWRFRVTAGVNLLGLVLAVVCFVGSYLYIDSLVRSDMHFPKAARTYVITQDVWNNGIQVIPAYPSAGPPVGAYLRADFPSLEAVARGLPLGLQSAAADERKAEVRTVAIDPEFLKIFDFDFKAGDPAVAATSEHSAIITERTAERLFGNAQALGRRILLQNHAEVTVTGVIAAVPRPSHLAEAWMAFDILVPMQLVKEMKSTAGIGVPMDPDSQDWSGTWYRTYVLFPANGSFTAREFLQQLPAFADGRLRTNNAGGTVTSKLGAVPLSHMSLAFDDAVYGGSALSVTTMIFALDALILAIACINYANLAVAIATTRAKELGVRKVLGATRAHLMRQCLVEVGMMSGAAVTLVIILAALAIEPLNRTLQTNFTVASLLMPQLWLMVVALIVAISLIGGMYPALALARVRPADALREGNVKAGPRFVPTLLVGMQFAAASFLLVVALIMAQQNRMMYERALQGGRDSVVAVLENNLGELGISFDTLRDQLLRNPSIEEVSSATAPPWQDGGWHVTVTRGAEAGAVHQDTILNPIGNHFFAALGLKRLAGRLLDQEHGDEVVPFDKLGPGQDEKVVIDRGLATALGWSDPNQAIGKLAYTTIGPWQLRLRIVGVVESGYPRLVGPNTTADVYALWPGSAGVPLIRISRQHVLEAVKHIEDTWNELAPKAQLRRDFMDSLFDAAYRNYSRINSTLNGLSVFAFLIAIMGLVGLAVHVTTRRQREIGIRKTLGATVHGVVTMLLIDFAKPVLIANLIAWPFAWLVGRQYVDKFTQRSEITIWPFVLGLAITLGLAWAAVAVQAIRAASVKPANVLYAE